MDSIQERLASVHERIADAARAAGRDRSEICLVGATKKKSIQAIRAAYAAGLRDFGENYVQELQRKAEACADLADIRFHMIGHLQRNKVRHVVRAASVVQSVDSVRLAQELGRRAVEWPVPESRRFAPRGRAADGRLVVLVEVNIGAEPDKSGCPPTELELLLRTVEEQPGLALAGLMTLPPHTPDPAGARPYFDALLRLRQQHGGPARLPELSMGMTHDFFHAVAAGATIVRVGTAIFGPRT